VIASHEPRVSIVTRTHAVIDDFLPPRVFDEVLAFCNRSDFRLVHATKVQKVWRLHDGFPLRGDTYRYDADPGTSPAASDRYPIGTVLDRFIEAVVGSMDRVGPVVGAPVVDWQEFTVAPWVYPLGAGLSLHQDTGRVGGHRYTGSYVFYAHSEWNLHWGGWLMVFDGRGGGGADATGPQRPRLNPPWLSDGIEDRLVRDSSLASAILPAPNRIVFISDEAPHMITRVDQNAGHTRASRSPVSSRPPAHDQRPR
jgi:hypothetical protein